MSRVDMMIEVNIGMSMPGVSCAILGSDRFVSVHGADLEALGAFSYIKHNSETLIIDINYKWSNPIQSTISTQLEQKGVAR